MELSEDQKNELAEIFLWRARFLLGIVLQDILDKTGVSQREIGRKAKEYQKHLKEKKFMYPKSKVALDQSAFSRLIDIKREPSYGQMYIFMYVFQQYFDGNEDVFPQELQDDLWRLALFGTPGKVYEAYMRHKHKIDESSPEFIEAYEEHKRKMEE